MTDQRVTGLTAQFRKQYPGGPSLAITLDLPLGPGITVVFGPSGCGKSTLLRCLAGLERLDEGQIRWGETLWADAATGVHRSPQQRRIGMMFQDYALFPHLTVERNVCFGIRPERDAPSPREQARAMLERLGLAGLEARYPRELSGGQQQRVALARVLVTRPRLVLLDEPLAALDSVTKDELRLQLRDVLAATGVPVLWVSHDRTDATALADRLLVLDAGRVIQQGPLPEVWHRPTSVSAARIVGMDTIVPGRIVAVTEGLAQVQVGSSQLTAVGEGPIGQAVMVCVRGEEVVLLPREPSSVSARNRLLGTVTTLALEGPIVRVRLDVGFPLVAIITRPACNELGLQVGAPVVALVKAPAVHLIPTG